MTPSRTNDGENSCPPACALASADRWLHRFLALVAATPSYQNGSVLVLVTYDEGRGWDNAFGENCADKAADLAGRQPSCHVPLFVIWRYARPGSNSTFFTLYSITRTIEDLFGLPCLAHACDPTTSLAGRRLPDSDAIAKPGSPAALPGPEEADGPAQNNLSGAARATALPIAITSRTAAPRAFSFKLSVTDGE